MSKTIPKNISNGEVLAHYLFDKSFRKKIIEEGRLIEKNIFLPNKGGVSLQRANYCNENKCKFLAINAVSDRKFVGFFCFTKNDFDKVKSEYLKSRPDFDAILKSTPLDKNFNYLPDDMLVTIDSEGNPAHADLKYLNPAIQVNENPNTAIRSFSKKLAKECKIILDRNPNELEYSGRKFLDVI